MSDLNCQILSDDSPSFDLSFKIIIVGDQGVGKSCLAIKASRNYFEDFYSPTVGFEFVSFNVRVQDKIIKLQIWDTCGQEVYRSLISSFFRSASLAIIVYSIDSEDSFNNIEKWLNDVKTQSNPDVKIFLIGNKADLEDKREVDKKVAENFKNDYELDLFMETSAKTGFNARELFVEAAKLLFKDYNQYKNSKRGNILKIENTANNNENKKKKGCC